MEVTQFILIGILLALYYVYRYKNRILEAFQDIQEEKPRICVVQYDDRPLSEIDKKFMQINQVYCQEQGYDHRFVKSGYAHLPPYWVKVKLVQDILDEDIYDAVMWIDTDAVITDHKTPITKFIYKDKAFAYCGDPPIWNSGLFNAGVWVVKGDSMGKEIMKDWMNSYKPNDWYRKSNGTWGTSGPWAGPTYEQGSFIETILPKYIFSLNPLPWYVFQEVNPYHKGTFACHFSAQQKILRETFLEATKKNYPSLA